MNYQGQVFTGKKLCSQRSEVIEQLKKEICENGDYKMDEVVPIIEKTQNNYPRKWNHLSLSGTFDRLHIGHKFLIAMATCFCKNNGCITLGLQGDSKRINNKVLSHLIQSYSKRESNIKLFFEKINKSNIHLNIVMLKDTDPKWTCGWGETVSNPTIEAVVVSSEPGHKLEIVQEERKRREMNLIDIIEVPLMYSLQNKGHKISSSDLRRKEDESRN